MLFENYKKKNIKLVFIHGEVVVVLIRFCIYE